MQLTFTIANATNCDVFSVFEQEMDIVIDVVNYLTERADSEAQQSAPPKKPADHKRDDFWDYV